jgi:stearoyl-CoA desaturase (delta-9 desaturase)
VAARAHLDGRVLAQPHHADPTAARHGVDRWQFDTTAECIRGFEKLGWATDVRWSKPERLDARRVAKTA